MTLFFSNMFRDIKDAYDILSDSNRKVEYDLRFKKEIKIDYNNFFPVIDFFRTNISEVRFGDEVIIEWKCLNADLVELFPFGTSVEPAGKRIFKSKNFDKSLLSFQIIATNTFIDKKVVKEVSLLNITYKILQEKIISDFSKSSEYAKSRLKKIDPNRKYLIYDTSEGIIKIVNSLPNRFYLFDRVYLDDYAAPNGSYKLEMFETIEVLDGVIVKI